MRNKHIFKQYELHLEFYDSQDINEVYGKIKRMFFKMLPVVKLKNSLSSHLFSKMLNINMHNTIIFLAVFIDVKCSPLLWEKNVSYKCLKMKHLGTFSVIRRIKYENI